MMTRYLPITAALLVCGASVGDAQSERHLAITVGQPGAVGLLWHVGNQLALRTDFAFSRSSTGSPTRSSSSSWSVTGGLSALLPVARIDSVRVYFAPRF